MQLNIRKKQSYLKKKWVEDLNRHYSICLLTDGQQTRTKMLNITNYWRDPSQNYKEVLPHTGQNGHHQKINK